MRIHKIAAIGGDGIGPEVVARGRRGDGDAFHSDGGFRFEVEQFPWSSDHYLSTAPTFRRAVSSG